MRFLIIMSLFGIGFLMNLNGFGDGLFQTAHAETEVVQEDDFKTLLELAEKGDVKAQSKIAKKYDLGDGVPSDIDEALKWYFKAAEKGDAVEQYRLGMLYNSGQKVPKDVPKALEWYRKSAARGNPWAYSNLALFNLIGVGVPKNVDKAISLYMRAAELGHAESRFTLAMLYYNGEYVSKDVEKAAYWFTKAAEHGDKSAQRYLDEINGVKREPAPRFSMVDQDDRRDFLSLNRISTQIDEDKSDCMDGGYSDKECICALEDAYSDFRQTLERHADWKGKYLEYEDEEQGIGLPFSSFKSVIDMYDKMCKD